jgi:hypothetical protein
MIMQQWCSTSMHRTYRALMIQAPERKSRLAPLGNGRLLD